MDDEKLVIKAQNGDKEAFTKLIQRYKKEMYCIAKSRLNNEVDIDDAIQETLYKAYVNIRKLKEPKYFKTWIIRILYNNCTDITRSGNGKIISFEEKILDSIPDDDDAYLDITNNCDFFELIDSLTDDEKTLITLKFSKDYDNKDIGKILNIKEGSVRMRFLRIKEKLKSKYKGEAKNE